MGIPICMYQSNDILNTSLSSIVTKNYNKKLIYLMKRASLCKRRTTRDSRSFRLVPKSRTALRLCLFRKLSITYRHHKPDLGILKLVMYAYLVMLRFGVRTLVDR